MRIPLESPVEASSRAAGTAVTVKALEITRGRDRSWARSHNVLYLSAYTSQARSDAGTSSFELALDYADARRLLKALQEELKIERAHERRLKARA